MRETTPPTPDRPHLKTIMKRLAASFAFPGLEEWVEKIEDPLDYDTPEEREAVLQENIAMLQSKITLFQRVASISAESADQFVANPGNFEYEEWERLEQVKADLLEYGAAIEEVAPPRQTTQESPIKGMLAKPSSERPKKRRVGNQRGWIPL